MARSENQSFLGSNKTSLSLPLPPPPSSGGWGHRSAVVCGWGPPVDSCLHPIPTLTVRGEAGRTEEGELEADGTGGERGAGGEGAQGAAGRPEGIRGGG